MNAIKLIQQNGVDRAREVVDGAPDWAFGYDFIDDDYFTGADIQDGYSIDQCDGCVCISDLKRLVESVDLIAYHGGINEAKEFLKCKSPNPKNNDGWNRFEQAIADYESIGGEHV